MSQTFQDLEQQLGKKAPKASLDRIAKAAKRLGGSSKVYVTNAVKKEITARIPLPQHKAIELCIFIEEPFTRMTMFFEGRSSEVERPAFDSPNIFFSIWLEEPQARKRIGQSLITRSLGFVDVALSDLASSQPEIYEEARALAGKFIELL